MQRRSVGHGCAVDEVDELRTCDGPRGRYPDPQQPIGGARPGLGTLAEHRCEALLDDRKVGLIRRVRPARWHALHQRQAGAAGDARDKTGACKQRQQRRIRCQTAVDCLGRSAGRERAVVKQLKPGRGAVSFERAGDRLCRDIEVDFGCRRWLCPQRARRHGRSHTGAQSDAHSRAQGIAGPASRGMRRRRHPWHRHRNDQALQNCHAGADPRQALLQ